LIEAKKPEGLPKYDYKTDAGRLRFARLGFDDFAKMTTDKLVFPDGDAPSFDEAKATARDVLRLINGTGLLIDPEFIPVSLYEISYTAKGRMGAADFGSMPRNKENTFLGFHPQHRVFSEIVLKHASTNSAVRFVLDALALPTTWASLYLVYDAIKDDIGGQILLEERGWATSEEFSNFRYSANTSRAIREGARHGGTVSAPKPLISLYCGRDIVERIVRGWLRSL